MFLSILFGLIPSGSITQSTQPNPLRDNSVSFENESRTSSFGLRIDARSLTKENFQKFYDGKQPIILTNVFDIKNELWTNELLTSLGAGDIEYDVRHTSDGFIESYEATLSEFVASLSENSDHDENMYLMNEDLLRNETKLLDFLKESESLFGKDLFQFFPDSIRPYQALIVGGVGARSFLHCDPYEWMGINYLFEGRKLWTFLSPDVPASLFEARRNAPDAWGAYNISAGWVSDIDLYRHRQSFVLGALAAAEMRRNGEDMAPGQEKIMGSSLNRKWLQTVLSKGNDDSNIESGAKNLNVPIFMSGVDAVDYCKDPRLSAGALQLVQEEGDLILIPPRFWHQVYHLEPSIAIASQYVNDIGKNVTFNHILKWCQSSSVNGAEGRLSVNLLPRNFTSLSDREQVLSVIQTGLKLQHGRMKGSALMRRLMSDTEKKGTED